MFFLALVLLLAIVLAIFKAYRNTFDVTIRQVEVSVDLPKGKELRILHLSDMHFENLSITPEALFARIKGLEVDLIALTGDQLERKRNIAPFMEYIKVLKRLNPPYGIYVIFGNHDYIMRKENLKLFRKTLEEHGCIVMQNENKALNIKGVNVNIIGIDDYSTRRSDIQKSYKGIKDGINLVLTHDPNLVLNMKDHHFDYLLSGHFHGGQIHWPKPYHLAKMGKLARMKIIRGLHYIDGRPFYISEGLGQTGVKIRAGTRPEIAIHRLKGTKSQKELSAAV